MKRNHHIRKLMACVLAISVCLTYSLGTALADEPQTSTTVSGSKTVENPEVTTITTKESNTDSQTGNTTDTTKIDKDWEGTTENKSIVGKEDAKLAETKSKYGNTLSGSGSASGSQTAKETTAAETANNIYGSNAADSGIATKADSITLSVEPTEGKQIDTKTGNVHAWFTPTAEIVPDWVGTIADGLITWNASSSSKDGNTVTNITVTSKPNNASEGTEPSLVTETIAADNAKDVTLTYTREDVSALRTVKYVYSYILDSHGHIIEYTQESYTTVTLSTAAEVPALSEIHTNGGYSSTSFELPKKPEIEAGQTPVYQEGTSTIISGQLIGELYNDAGKHVGYVRVTYAGGKEVKYEAFMGGEVTTASSRETLANGLKKDTVTKTAHTETKGSAVSNSVIDGSRTASASMTGITNNIKDENQDLTKGLKTYVPTIKNTSEKSSIIIDTKTDTYKYGTVDKNTDLFYRPASTDLPADSDKKSYFRWLGQYGIESSLRLLKDKNYQTHLFVVKGSNDEEYYAYCADFHTAVSEGAYYNVQRLEDVGNEYYKNNTDEEKSAIKQVRAIALNGYWGTDPGTDTANPNAGSLAAFKKMLKDSGKFDSYNLDTDLTDGVALAATQAAIWYYANTSDSSDDSLPKTGVASGKAIDKYTYLPKNNDWQANFVDANPNKIDLLNAAYAYLINANNEADNLQGVSADAGNTLLTKDDFAQKITLTIKEKDGNNYKTSVSVTMPKVLEKYESSLKLSFEIPNGSESPTKVEYPLTAATYTDGTNGNNGTYTIDDVILPVDTDITLGLEGTQTIDNGVYLFTCTTGINQAQTFIAAGSTTQAIDFSTSFEFDVTDPVLTLSSANATSAADTLEWDSSYTIRYVSTSNPTEETPEQPEDGDTPDGDKTDDSDAIGGDDSDNNGNRGDSEILGDDSYADVDIPKTGDINSTLLKWFALIGVSAAGILTLKHRRRKQNASDKA